MIAETAAEAEAALSVKILSMRRHFSGYLLVLFPLVQCIGFVPVSKFSAVQIVIPILFHDHYIFPRGFKKMYLR